ncbi:MAG: hypothetical protein H7X88_04340, partial [Gloeobacteraceae cyanobacterium ES-bin-316]|nr:hypothetical protein [Ferruginibacter sp.]
MEKFISVSFTADEATSAMITALLMDEGFTGAEEGEDQTIVTVTEQGFSQENVKDIFNKFNVLYHIETIEQQNWNAQWEKSFEPVCINNFAAIR